MKSLGIWILAIIVFVLMGIGASYYDTFPGDVGLTNWIQGISFTGYQTVLEGIIPIGSEYGRAILVGVFAISLFCLHRRKESLVVAMVPALNLLNSVAKEIVDRPRPDILINPGPSFPSGHVVFHALFLGLAIYLMPTIVKNKSWLYAIRGSLVTLGILVGVSVVYTSRHWPSDALGGYIMGGALLVALIWFYKKVLKGNR